MVDTTDDYGGDWDDPTTTAPTYDSYVPETQDYAQPEHTYENNHDYSNQYDTSHITYQPSTMSPMQQSQQPAKEYDSFGGSGYPPDQLSTRPSRGTSASKPHVHNIGVAIAMKQENNVLIQNEALKQQIREMVEGVTNGKHEEVTGLEKHIPRAPPTAKQPARAAPPRRNPVMKQATGVSYDNELRNAHKRMEIYKKANEVLRRQINASLNPEKIASLTNRIAEQDLIIQQLTSDNKTLKSELRRLGREYEREADAQGDYPNKMVSVLDEARAIKEKLRQYQARHDADDKSMRKQQQHLVDLETKCRRLNQTIKEMEAREAELKQQLNAAEKRANAGDVEKDESKQQQENAELEKLRARITELEHSSEQEKQRSRRIITQQKQKIVSLMETLDNRRDDGKKHGKPAPVAAAAGTVLPKLNGKSARAPSVQSVIAAANAALTTPPPASNIPRVGGRGARVAAIAKGKPAILEPLTRTEEEVTDTTAHDTKTISPPATTTTTTTTSADIFDDANFDWDSIQTPGKGSSETVTETTPATAPVTAPAPAPVVTPAAPVATPAPAPVAAPAPAPAPAPVSSSPYLDSLLAQSSASTQPTPVTAPTQQPYLQSLLAASTPAPAPAPIATPAPIQPVAQPIAQPTATATTAPAQPYLQSLLASTPTPAPASVPVPVTTNPAPISIPILAPVTQPAPAPVPAPVPAPAPAASSMPIWMMGSSAAAATPAYTPAYIPPSAAASTLPSWMTLGSKPAAAAAPVPAPTPAASATALPSWMTLGSGTTTTPAPAPAPAPAASTAPSWLNTSSTPAAPALVAATPAPATSTGPSWLSPSTTPAPAPVTSSISSTPSWSTSTPAVSSTNSSTPSWLSSSSSTSTSTAAPVAAAGPIAGRRARPTSILPSSDPAPAPVTQPAPITKLSDEDFSINLGLDDL